ncbi:MAG: diphthine synthase [Methanomicrobiales archaeon]|nr:diphthine synthase [Methanomicrobiales archaeon]
MLTFVGLGLSDERDISVKGLACIRRATHLYLETYTSRLTGTSVERMEQCYGKPVIPVGREEIEQRPGEILDRAENGEVVLLCGGDPMVSTTHADLRLRAAARGIPTRIIHGASIASAVCGLTGLQNYRFGKSCSLPFPSKGWFPVTPLSTIRANLSRDLHTLVYLDITPDRCMTVGEGIVLLEEMARKEGIVPPAFYVGIARAGSAEPRVAAGPGEVLKEVDFGPPLHILAVPATLHDIEREYLEVFARP